MLRSRQDAEDATQEALLRAWRARARCDSDDAPDPWVGRIARNEALRLGARLSQRREREGESMPEQIIDRSAQAEDQRGRLLANALSGLPPGDAELVRLRYLEDLQYLTIAERLELPLGTVKVRLHRLHTRLRRITADEGIPRDI